jgi:amino acid transporter
MVNYSLLDVGDPLAFVFAKLDLKWMSGIIAGECSNGECIVGFSRQPRIWMSMSRDGLLPKKFREYIQNTIPCNSSNQFVVAVPALFLNLTMVTDLCSRYLVCFCTCLRRSFSLAKQNGYSEENSKRLM